LQRRIKVWRARHGAAREVMFTQVHLPGRQAQSDFTFMNELGVTITGQRFDQRRLDKFEALIIDDIGYVQHSREEMEVLFPLLAHRYEHRSVLLTSNLVFSQWEQIFKDPMTTAAAIDRVVRRERHPRTQCAELPHGSGAETTRRACTRVCDKPSGRNCVTARRQTKVLVVVE
jgi:hypothetical protein